MSTPMTSADQIGKVQELDLNRIFMVKPELTPFTSSLDTANGLLNQELAEWLAKTFPLVNSTATPDNTATASYNRQDRAKIQAYVHYFRDAYSVSKLANKNMVGGGINRNELAEQRMASLMRLRLMIEQQFGSNDDTASDNGSVGYTSRGVFKWLSSSAQGTLPVDSTLRPASGNSYTGAIASLDETALVGLFNSAYDDVRQAQKFDLFAMRGLKNVIDKLTLVHPVSSATSQPKVQYIEQGVSKYNSKVEVLDLSVATVNVHLVNLLDRTTSTGAAASANSINAGFYLNLDMWSIADLMPLNHEELPRDGSGYKGQYERVCLLKCGNPKGQGYILPTS